MNKGRFLVLASVALAFSIPSFAEGTAKAAAPKKAAAPQVQNQSIDEMESLQSVKDKLADINTMIERSSKQKHADCLKAFGVEKFCTCLTNNSPVGIDFPSYIHIVTSTKEVLGYDALTNEEKKVIDATLKTRELCVSQVSGGN